MGQKPLHNIVIAITAPGGSQVILSLTAPEPGALRLTEAVGGCQHSVVPGEVTRMLADGFRQLDELTVNKPTPPVPAEPKSQKDLDDDGSVSGEKHKAKHRA